MTAIMVASLSAFPQLFSNSVKQKASPAFQPSSTYYDRLASRIRSRKSLKDPNSIDEDLYDPSVGSGPGNTEQKMSVSPCSQSWETQHNGYVQNPTFQAPVSQPWESQHYGQGYNATIQAGAPQSWVPQNYGHAQIPGMLQPYAVCHPAEGAEGGIGTAGHIRRDVEYQVTHQWA